MAFSAAKTGEHVIGDLRMTRGTWDGGSETGGNINTGLHQCLGMWLTATGGTIVADAPTVDETFPVDGSAVTIIVTSDTNGYWYAIGY